MRSFIVKNLVCGIELFTLPLVVAYLWVKNGREDAIRYYVKVWNK